MKRTETGYGTLCIGSKEAIFDEAIALADRYRREKDLKELTWALTGGSTPAEFYRYCAEGKKLPEELVKATSWFTSDERMVPLSSDESNFGNANRMLLDPLNVPEERRFPWPVDHPPADAAHLFTGIWNAHFSDFQCFDLCFLGMGDDCHTASIFPHSPLIADRGKEFFTHVEVPGKGYRLTVTQLGLEKCGQIVVMAMGKSKGGALSRVFNGLYDPKERPIQLLRNHASRTTWLLDEEAGAALGNP